VQPFRSPQFERLFSSEITKMDIFLFLRTFTPPCIVLSLKDEQKKKIRLSTEVTSVKRNTVYIAPWPESSITSKYF